MAKKKTKIVFGAGTKKVSHSPASKHVSMKGKGGKKAHKKMCVKA